jgi:enoyl-CoA hydratase/carnithine racemase
VDFKKIILKQKGGIAKITLNRPEEMNSLDMGILHEMETALYECEKDDNIRVVIITGKGRAFSAGADLKMQLNVIAGNIVKELEFIRLVGKVTDAIYNLSKPVIAAINGFALAGGLEIVTACDLAIAADNAQIGDQHINYAFLPGAGNSQRLPRLIGIRKAKEYLFTGKWMSAQEAKRLGLVNQVVSADKLEETADEMAANLACKSPQTMKILKRLVNLGVETNLGAGLEMEGQACVLHIASDDAQEGLRAFIEKREPKW